MDSMDVTKINNGMDIINNELTVIMLTSASVCHVLWSVCRCLTIERVPFIFSHVMYKVSLSPVV